MLHPIRLKACPVKITFFALVTLLSMLPTTLLSLTIHSSLMVNPQSKKSVVLFDDAHYEIDLQKIAKEKGLKLNNQLFSAQQEYFTKLAHTLIGLNPTQGAQTVVITELDNNSFGCLVEQEAGATEIPQTGNETFHVLPRLFLRHLFEQGTSVDSKMEIFETAMQPFNDMPAASFVLSNNTRWVAGDRRRTAQDAHLVFTTYRFWSQIKTALQTDEWSSDQTPEDIAIIKNLTIGNVKDYIETLHAEFEKYGLTDAYYNNIMSVITTILQTTRLSESDHIALLHEHLLNTGQKELRDQFSSNLLSFISQKFDVELYDYLEAFEKDKTLNTAINITGAAHSNEIKTFLIKRGYTIEKKAGIELVVGTVQEEQEQFEHILKNINNNVPFIDTKDWLG